MPSWEIVGFGHMIPNVFFPAILLPGITFGVLQMWPFIEARLTHDHAEHQILDRPRDRPKRTAFGAAVFSFYFVLFGASATDVLANYLSISLNVVLTSFRFLAVIVPLVVFPVTFRICKEMQSVPTAGKRKRANVVLRSAEGGYSTVPSEEATRRYGAEGGPTALDEDFQFVNRVGWRRGCGRRASGERTRRGFGAGAAGRGPRRPSARRDLQDPPRLPLRHTADELTRRQLRFCSLVDAAHEPCDRVATRSTECSGGHAPTLSRPRRFTGAEGLVESSASGSSSL